MSKMIIEKNMQGKLYVNNRDGGATFTIELALASDFQKNSNIVDRKKLNQQ